MTIVVLERKDGGSSGTSLLWNGTTCSHCNFGEGQHISNVALEVDRERETYAATIASKEKGAAE